MILDWSETIGLSLINLWDGFIAFVPELLGAIIVFFLGWLIAEALGKVLTRLLRALQVDKVFDTLGVMKAIHKGGLNWEFSGFIGWLVKWFLLIAFFLAAADILGLSELATFFNGVLMFVPNIFISAIILLMAALFADFLEKIIKSSMKAAGFSAPNTVGVVVRWSIWVFAILAIFDQLGIAQNLVNTLFMGFVAFLAIAGGLAFGFGGQGVAKEFLEGLSKEMKGKR
jgi:small-conductance mechanosensitive channel